jgi:hypothetical protein
MNDARLDFEKRRYDAIREWVKAGDPDIDERTLVDTVEGLSNYPDILAAIVRGAISDEYQVDALKSQIDDLVERRDRFKDRADKRREVVRYAMLESHIPKLTPPDFTASLRPAPPAVRVIDEKQIARYPQFWEMRPHLKKRELLDALKAGEQIDGAALSNPEMSLTVRKR